MLQKPKVHLPCPIWCISELISVGDTLCVPTLPSTFFFNSYEIENWDFTKMRDLDWYGYTNGIWWYMVLGSIYSFLGPLPGYFIAPLGPTHSSPSHSKEAPFFSESIPLSWEKRRSKVRKTRTTGDPYMISIYIYISMIPWKNCLSFFCRMFCVSKIGAVVSLLSLGLTKAWCHSCWSVNWLVQLSTRACRVSTCFTAPFDVKNHAMKTHDFEVYPRDLHEKSWLKTLHEPHEPIMAQSVYPVNKEI